MRSAEEGGRGDGKFDETDKRDSLECERRRVVTSVCVFLLDVGALHVFAAVGR